MVPAFFGRKFYFFSPKRYCFSPNYAFSGQNVTACSSVQIVPFQSKTLLVMLDLSAAFDTVDHGILLQRLQSKLGLRGTALLWFKSYLAVRTQQVSINGTLSEKYNLCCGVPQGSCPGPLLFTIYASTLFDILKFHLPSVHTYAGDTQLHNISFNPAESTNEAQAVAVIENCIYDVGAWMWNNKLMLNEEKTEFLIIGMERQLSKVSVDRIKVGAKPR